MNSREVVYRSVRFECPERMAYDLREQFGSDFFYFGMDPSPEQLLQNGVDPWGAVWESVGNTKQGEVKGFPLKTWEDFDKLIIPDVNAEYRWKSIQNVRREAGDKFLTAFGITIYMRVTFLRGLENTWMDIYTNRAELERLIDILTDMNIAAVRRFSKLGADGYYFWDDWGFQDRLMISPDLWREIWKPRYKRIWDAVHEEGMLSFLHSCGYIVDILDDLIEAGLDVIQMDQQQNMGLEMLSERFGGRITFFCPVDIQNMMINGSLDDIRGYCRKLAKTLGREKGGFIAKMYGDPVGAGHTDAAVKAMCEEFLKMAGQM